MINAETLVSEGKAAFSGLSTLNTIVLFPLTAAKEQ
ncbi:hypothetical protein ECP02994384_5182, partial [Escherichia coli P0299438.4]